MTQRAVYAGIFFGTFLAYVSAAVAFGTLFAPPELGDGQDYDALAFNIWHHRGFGFDWDNAEWRAPYQQYPRYKEVLDRHSSFHPTTYRPPAMPFLLGLLYSVVGRSFAAWRLLNCAIMAGAATITAAIAARFAGTWAALISAALSVLNPQFIASSQRFLTEALGTFFVALLVWAWLDNEKTDQTVAHAAKLGLILGLLILTRSLFVLWIPAVLFLHSKNPSAGKWSWRPKAAFVLVCLAVIGPWLLRNILVTGEFMPLGTQGAIASPAGFGPRALQLHGVWAPDDEDGAPELAAQNLDPLTYEVRLAQFRSALTFRWMRQHPMDVLYLMLLHVWQELRPHGRYWSDWLVVAGAFAAFFFRKSQGTRVLVLFFCLNMLSVAMTWSGEGRFMVPIQPILIALVAAMAAEFGRQAMTSAGRKWVLRT